MNPHSPARITGSPVSAETLPLLRILAEFFAGRSATAHLVGGTLRDALLGRQSGDIDIAVSGDAISLGRELAAVTGGSFVSLNETHATARVVLPDRWSAGGEPTARIHVDLTSCGEEITQDLARRDFTIDALALPLDNALAESPSDRLIDPLGGLADLAAATLRPASDRVFQDDPVRLLRSVRLAAQLGFSLDDSAVQLIKRDSHLLTTVAPERLRDELLKTLAEPGASLHLRLMDDLGLLCLLIPELEEARGVEQPREHYWNVFYHCVEAPGALEQVTDRDAIADNEVLACVPWHSSLDTYFDEEISDGHTRRTILKLGCLLHDISKPATKSIEPTGRIRFIGHDVQGAEVCDTVLRRLRMSSRATHLVSTMVKHHLRPTQMRQGVEMPTQRAIYRFFRDLESAAIDTLYLNMADYMSAKGPRIVDKDDWQGHCQLIGHILHQGLRERDDLQKTPKLMDGHLLMETLGIAPGPALGRLLEALMEAQGAGEISTREEALDLAGRLLKDPSAGISQTSG